MLTHRQPLLSLDLITLPFDTDVSAAGTTMLCARGALMKGPTHPEILAFSLGLGTKSMKSMKGEDRCTLRPITSVDQ
jgi:hypothetical protein